MFQISPLSPTPTFMTRMASPLARRNPNVCPRFPYQMASSEEKIYDRSLPLQKRLPQKPFQQRRPEEEQERRRGAFLKKVRQSSDDRRWESRSEQILQRDFLSRQRQWEQEQAHSAPEELSTPEDEEMETDQAANPSEEVDMVDQILSQEDQEFEALISLMQPEDHEEEPTMSAYGSDDEEYDQLFQDVMSKETVAGGNAKEAEKTETEEVMDMSVD